MYNILYTYVHSIVHHSSFGTPSGKDCTTYCTGLYTIPPFGTPSGNTVQDVVQYTPCTGPCTPHPKTVTLINSSFGTRIGKPQFGTPSGMLYKYRHSGRHPGILYNILYRIVHNTAIRDAIRERMYRILYRIVQNTHNCTQYVQSCTLYCTP